MERRGRWIWRDRGGGAGGIVDAKLDSNLFVMFRRNFTVDAASASATARISADGRYRLYVNGVYVGRGPARCEPLFQYYDVYDLAPYLSAGRNVVAVLVHAYGRDMSWYELPRTQWSRTFGCGGLFFECDVGQQTRIDSDPAWHYAVADARSRDTPPGAVGFVEIYDARLADDGWTSVAYDDSAWSRAIELRAPGIGLAPDVVPFPQMVERDIPPLIEERRDAARVINIAEIAAEPDTDLLGLAEAAPEPLTRCSIVAPDALLSGGGETEFRLASGRAATLVIDFGRDVTGYPRLELAGPAGATVDVSYAERLRDDGRVPVQRPNPVTSQNVHRYILRDGQQSWEKFDRAGFRYLQLTVAPARDAPSAPVTIRRANINFTSYDTGARGSFACSEDDLTRIWQAGAYTLQLCTQDGYEDCPSREQRQWVGDAYVESLVNYACFGDTRLTAKLLRQVTQSQMRDGMTQMATPSDMSARWPLHIVDYCLAWIMTAGEYALHSGDASVAHEIFPAVVRAVAWFERHLGADGLLVDPPGWIFLDWAEVDRRGASGALNALLAQALRHAATIARGEGALAIADRWRALAVRIGDAINATLWDDVRGVYVDAIIEGKPSRRVSQHTTAAIVAAGLATPERRDRALDYMMDPARLVETSSAMFTQASPISLDEERQVVLAQPFFMHHLHRALAAAGRHEALVDNIRERWSPMLGDDGTGTLWEHWHGRDSRCHAWSATPVYDLSREVLGVRPLTAGYARFAVEPHLSGLTWARGRYPSPRGDIAVAWRLEGGRFSMEIVVPATSEADVALPAGARDVLVNDALPQAAIMWGADGRPRLALDPGAHTINARLES